MKTYLIDTERERELNPCTHCESGWGSSSTGEDERGKFIETTSCRDNCPKLKKLK